LRKNIYNVEYVLATPSSVMIFYAKYTYPQAYLEHECPKIEDFNAKREKYIKIYLYRISKAKLLSFYDGRAIINLN